MVGRCTLHNTSMGDIHRTQERKIPLAMVHLLKWSNITTNKTRTPSPGSNKRASIFKHRLPIPNPLLHTPPHLRTMLCKPLRHTIPSRSIRSQTPNPPNSKTRHIHKSNHHPTKPAINPRTTQRTRNPTPILYDPGQQHGNNNISNEKHILQPINPLQPRRTMDKRRIRNDKPNPSPNQPFPSPKWPCSTRTPRRESLARRDNHRNK